MEEEKRLEALAKRVRARYCAEYRRYEERVGLAGRGRSTYGDKPLPHLDGGTGTFGRRHQPVWPRIARFCLDNGLDQDLLIREFFESRLGGRPPAANELFGAEAMALYARAARTLREEVAQSFRSETSQASTLFVLAKRENPGESDAVVWTRVLTDPQADFSPLFRYCLAKGVGAEKAAAGYREDAFWQYLRSPEAYDEAMAEVVPHELRAEAARVQEATL